MLATGHPVTDSSSVDKGKTKRTNIGLLAAYSSISPWKVLFPASEAFLILLISFMDYQTDSRNCINDNLTPSICFLVSFFKFLDLRLHSIVASFCKILDSLLPLICVLIVLLIQFRDSFLHLAIGRNPIQFGGENCKI